MPRFVLKGSDLGALLIAEAPSEHDAVLWGYRHLAELPGFTGGVESADGFYERTRAPLLESFRARYASEGASTEEAERMAQTACGDRPRLPVVWIATQDPMPRAAANGKG